MPNNKRNLEEEEDNNRNNKRIRSNSHINRSQSVTLQLSLNQLMLNSRSRKENFKMNGNCGKKCFNCLSEYLLDSNSCHFCERIICADCSLTCIRCCDTYCRLCAVKSYQFSHQNNVGFCLTCDSRT